MSWIGDGDIDYEALDASDYDYDPYYDDPRQEDERW
ncbi:hypothetical protein SEA_JACKO_20 [Microbacterium phage Jacko]|nr:hypothetical protein SEA_JACKO_20 [Microbacterium phage Jacko]